MILVTGGAGYIGCVLVEELLAKGESVRVYDKLYFGETGLGRLRDKVDLVQGDLRQFDSRVLDGIDSVIHLAGLSNDPTAEFNPKANYEMNTVATGVLAKACKQRGIKRFTFASSCSIYDRGLFSEDLLYDENSPVAPRAAYAVSNYEAERILLDMCDDDFCPVILRQGTVYGFSPRMRYDLVVNTFVKDALIKGILTVFCGGEMWRPLVDVSDTAKAHICCVEAPAEKVRGQIFNLAYKNYRILELAHWVREALKDRIKLDIQVDYSHYKARSYRVSSQKIETVLGFKPIVAVKESVQLMIQKIYDYGYTDFLHPRYYNIEWMTLLYNMEQTLAKIGSVF
ncbi:MAG: SDR family oxidoreductase [Candidatus Abyssobacteria bacterium SURF_17]|jgi:nucleoside-diphosphate-sugar epimerase|uniref:SDR family oxidoreductase n=1 Tax=Candidatus Abyssobacteria bacterium SURF_17 TaxID=2093361 RepID=A0A419ESN9_9BACT|nr:MAG: SDR family oxidoreductase [Candidatus Abyssubacteria bacterium SURF_17]